jgi:hypothetical protein
MESKGPAFLPPIGCALEHPDKYLNISGAINAKVRLKLF